jgi:hypothetical protein
MPLWQAQAIAHDIDWNCYSKPKPIPHEFRWVERYSKHKSIAHVFGEWNCNGKPKPIFHDID